MPEPSVIKSFSPTLELTFPNECSVGEFLTMPWKSVPFQLEGHYFQMFGNKKGKSNEK